MAVVPDIIICAIIVGTLGIIHITTNFIRNIILGGFDSDLTLSQLIDQSNNEYGWILKILVNLFGYSCVIVPGLIIFQYTKRTHYLDKYSSGLIPKAVKFCFSGIEFDYIDSSHLSKAANNTVVKDCALVSFCFVGLMGSYLTWGLLQERIMTQPYINSEGKHKFFKDSQFLVFSNRALAFGIAAAYLFSKKMSRHRAPLYKYSYASLANIMSTWFQYEALKFVNFPTQVLAKSCKIIPVMLMGKVVFRAKYEFYEYFSAVLISLGMILFLMGSATGAQGSSITTITGVLFLTLYMAFDSFTSNWQGDLFKTYSMSSIEMMCGVNLFSTLFTAASLSIQGGFMESLDFATEHMEFVFHCVILSISSAVGQLFIFYTIATFGPVVFTIIMTVRQAVAIIQSCIVYDHHISNVGMFGVTIVFFAIFLRVYSQQRLKAIKKRAEAAKLRITAT
ncbi:Adenosine 3'-phospho 5'-phosphosulfate transporter 1 [Pseudolycoriella hygida]|uniref:Adenosine 3'-phospho 5'-phosphosulfate transporter 1 n=1 Tax=Pseudolycoriella hygida TaxID=35572 RepID=A0A9Q0MR73_9DIPT|nr:Adenosine 3'-phospho 5'-phosphosulfate transporter 1 [Pseudolycoriella hygida]